jgi:S1-C subfamily serine protease
LINFNVLSVTLGNLPAMRDTDSNKFIALVAIIAAPFALGAFLLTWAPSGQYSNEDPSADGYVPPRSIEKLVERTQESTVTVWCDPIEGKGSQGTAWAIELETSMSKEYPTTLITNHHVIDTCIGVDSLIEIALPYEDPVEAVIVRWDIDNDLAVLATKLELPVLSLSDYDTYPGYWVMAIGSADGYEGSVAFGNVINSNASEILVTNNISGGNSGGPLVDNEGNVVGVVTWTLDEEQYNGAKSLNAFCAKILQCEFEIDGKKTWWDYSGN